MAAASDAASRNAPCPCGSGLRFKHCHGRADVAASAAGVAAPPPAAADEAHWAAALAAHPGDPEALFHLGNHARARGEPGAAIRLYEAALAGAATNPALLNNLGLALEEDDRIAAAEPVFRRALAAAPDAFNARANLAQNLYRQRRHADALAEYATLVQRFAVADAAIWANMAVCQRQVGATDAALASFGRALQRAPDSAPLHLDAGTLLWEMRRYEEARAALARCLELDPAQASARYLLSILQAYQADWTDFDARRRELHALAAAGGDTPAARISFNAQALFDEPALELALARQWMAKVARPDVPRPAVAPAADGRLRLGFVSLDFADHPVGRLVAPLLERLPRDAFRVTAYALGPRPEPASGVRARIAAAVEHWREIESIDAERIAAQVRADGIDVLVDLNGFTRRVADVFVLRPAPLQVNFLGYTGTLGLDCYDFIVADRYCLRDDERAHYAEAPLYVDPCYLPWEPVRDVAAAPPRAAYGLPERAPVLYVPAQAYKIMPETFACWIDLMRERADAVLWLRANEPATDARLAAEAARRGIPPERVVFAPHEPTPRYLARLPLADLVLDTYPFGAHTGVNDALYAGVPVLTRAGASFASRASASQLRAAGLAGLVAGSEDEYRALGRRLVGDDAQLQALRRQLAAARTTAPLFDADRYARAFGAAILAAWDARARAGTGA